MSEQQKNSPGLVLDDDLPLHNTGWKVQKIGWIIALLFLVMAALGLFGTGPASHQVSHNGADVVEFERFLRYESEAEIIFTASNVKDTLTLSIPENYFAYVNVNAITPLPARNSVHNNVVTYYFPVNGDAKIFCTIMAKKSGKVSENFMVNNRPFIISHLIYP
ncbi:MAG TPA: hypothetical protein VK625_05335 [Flavitalea sp.]|nr:hypothetical protein [Flavitalea sp.]